MGGQNGLQWPIRPPFILEEIGKMQCTSRKDSQYDFFYYIRLYFYNHQYTVTILS